jgi:hypothetical protein
VSPPPPPALAGQMGGRSLITIRVALPGDREALTRLAAVADRRLPPPPLLVAESDGELLAALSSHDGEAVTDPFRATADLVALLRLRLEQLSALAA